MRGLTRNTTHRSHARVNYTRTAYACRICRQRNVAVKAYQGNARWAQVDVLSVTQLDDLHRLRRNSPEQFVEILQDLSPKCAAQLRAELLPAELRQIIELQMVHKQQIRAEKVAAQLQSVVDSGTTTIDSERMGFWLDMLSKEQIQLLWNVSNGQTRALINRALLAESKSELDLDMNAPQKVVEAADLSSKLSKLRLPLNSFHKIWKQRYGPFVYTDPKDYTVMQGGKRRGQIYPNGHFSDYDVRRIKAIGPTLHDLVLQQWDLPAKTAKGSAKQIDAEQGTGGRVEGEKRSRDQEIESFNIKHAHQDERFQFIHPEVVWDTKAFMKQPRWRKMKKMPYMEFFHGLRQRNWTSPYYVKDIEPWNVDLYLDGGQRWPRTAFGVRAVVTKSDGSKYWIDMLEPGTEVTLSDRLSNGGPGGIFNEERLPAEKTIDEYGYLQIFEQLQQAYEQYIPGDERDGIMQEGGRLFPKSYKYEDPGSKLINVSYYITPPQKDFVFSVLQWRWFVLGGIVLSSFLGSFFYNLTMKTKAKDRRQGAFEDMNEAIDFGRSRADSRMEGKTGVLLRDVAGIDYLKDELEEVIDLLKNPAKFHHLRVRPPKGILLMGPPGVGKTLIAKAVAGQAGVPFYSLAGSEFTELIVGVGAARVRDLFKRARVNVPCLIFIDEIEALGHKREMNDSESRNEERDQALNQLLTEMDGFTPDTGIVVMAATNAPELIDEALLRPGRFDRKINVRKPNSEARKAILEVHAMKHPITQSIDFAQLAKDTPGLSGAELEKVLNESALETLRRNEDEVSKEVLYYALERVLEGSSLPPLPRHYDCNKVFATHESGVALISEVLRRDNSSLQAVKCVSLIPRNRSWSRTTYFLNSDKSYKMLNQEDLKRQIQIQLAGRAAEEVIFGEPTTYSALDIARASDIAVKMLNSGLTDHGVLPFTFSHDFFTTGIIFSDPQVQLARQELLDITSGMSTNDPHGLCPPSDITSFKAETTVRELISEAYEKNLVLLRNNKDALEQLSQALLDKTELYREDLMSIIS